MTLEYDDVIRAETIVELANGLLNMTRDIMELHGEGQPQMSAMICAAYVMAIRDLETKIDKTIPKTIAQIINERSKNVH